MALSGRILSPSCSKMAWRWPNIAQHSAKMSQHSLQEPPTRPPKTPKCGQNAIVMLIFTCRPFLPKSAPRPFKIAKMAPPVASRWRSGAQLGPSWRHLGSILAPSWPTWRHLGAKMRPNSHPNGAPDALQIASWASLAPRGSPRTSKVPLEPQFSMIFPRIMDRIRLIFQAAFGN